MRLPSALVLTLCILPFGCETPSVPASSETPADPEHGTFLSGKADGGCLAPNTPAAEGVLAYVNDPAVSVEELDAPTSNGGAGLDRRAAQGIVEARPFATLEALDAVSYVGPHACRALARHACNEEDRCRQPLSMMTWNLRHFPLTSRTEDIVVDTVTDFAPDLVGIQEVQDEAALRRVAERLPEFDVYIAEPGPYSGVAALVRTSALTVERAEDLFEDDWYPFPRPMLALDLRVSNVSSPIDLRVGVVHLKARSDAQSRARRRAASTELRDWFDAGGEQGLSIVLGDFNDEVTDAPSDNVFAPLLDDAHVTFLTESIEAEGASTYIPWSRMLDHIAVSTPLLPHHLDTEVLPLDQSTTYEQHVSDHRPVLTVFSFPIHYNG